MNATAAYGFYMSRRPGLGALSGKMGTSMLRLSVALEPVNGLRKTKSPYSRSAKIIPRAKLKNSGFGDRLKGFAHRQISRANSYVDTPSTIQLTTIKKSEKNVIKREEMEALAPWHSEAFTAGGFAAIFGLMATIVTAGIPQ